MESVDMNLDSEVSSNEDAAQQRPSKPTKLRRSCELCRSHKARCNPSEANPDRCHRCTRDGKQCIFLAAKARPKRAKNSKARVAEMEQKLDSLVALLNSQGRVPQNVLTPSITPPPAESLGCGELDEQSAILLNLSAQRHEILNNPHQFSLFSLPKPNIDILGDVISKDIISYETAEQYVQYYRSKSKYFPFVVIPSHESLDTLRRERPFLLLVMLSMAAVQSSMKLQKILDLELRENLSRRTVVNGEKSLDVVQGLLVYLAWYHFFFDPHRQQIYQLSQMAITMVIDLGINKPEQSPSSPNLNPIDLICPIPSLENKDDPEAKRALLGCFFLTSSVCQSLRKPNNMRYNDYLGELCSYFAQNPVTNTDHLLQYFVRLQHFQDEVNAAFDYDATHNLQPLDAARIGILLNTFNRQLIQFEESFPPEIWENVQITTMFYSLRIYLHEIGFHAKQPLPAYNIQTTNSNARSWYHSTTRTESLFACLQASKDYLDRLLLVEGDVFISLALPDFFRFIYVLLILGSFACLTDYPQIQALANLQYYLSAFHHKTNNIIQTATNPIADCFLHLHRLFEKTSAWHSKTMADPTSVGKCLMWHPQFNVPDMLPDAISRVLGLGELFVEDEMGGMMLWGGNQIDIGLGIDWTGGENLGLDGGDDDLSGDVVGGDPGLEI